MRFSKFKTQLFSALVEAASRHVDIHAVTYRCGRSSTSRDTITVDGQEVCSVPAMYRWWTEEELEKQFGLEFAQLAAAGSFDIALRGFRNCTLQQVLQSENVLVAAFAMLDRRLGKRHLLGMDCQNRHALIRLFHQLRCRWEGAQAEYAELPLAQYSLAPRPSKKIDRDRSAAMLALLQDKKLRGAERLLCRIRQGKLTDADATEPWRMQVCMACDNSANRAELLEQLGWLSRRCELLESSDHRSNVIHLLSFPEPRVRNLYTWRASSHNLDRQFSSLARHLFALYPVPLFMDAAWCDKGEPLERQWFLHLGLGKNMRSAPKLPVPLTKKMAHWFMQAPQDYSIAAAFRWGQVHALGGTARLANALRESRLVRDFRDNAFSLSVIRFFVENPMLDLIHVNPIVDYLYHQRLEPRIIFPEPGLALQVGPAQPGLSLRGRSPDALLKQVRAWHKELGRAEAGKNLSWKNCAIPSYSATDGSESKKDMRAYHIVELLNGKELIEEGRMMKHCVATYANSCHARRSAIWSMRAEDGGGMQRCLTLEVDLALNQIRQIRGVCNRLPTPREFEVVKRWAQAADLKIADYVRSEAPQEEVLA